MTAQHKHQRACLFNITQNLFVAQRRNRIDSCRPAVHPHVFPAQILQGPQQQPGKRQQHHRKCDLGDDRGPWKYAV